MSAPHLFPHFIADPALRRQVYETARVAAQRRAMEAARDAEQRRVQQLENNVRQAHGRLASAMIDGIDAMRMPVEDPSRRHMIEAADARLRSAEMELSRATAAGGIGELKR